MCAASAWQSITSRLATAKVLLAQWDLTPIPISADVVLALGASLKAGGYRSAALYLSAVKVHSERHGFITSNVVERLIKDAVRSCERGQGAPKQAAALPLERLHLLPTEDSPWVEGGPVGPAQAIVAGAWWLTREIELSCTRAVHVSLAGDPATAGALVATWHLPASKADARAAGVSRTHGCACCRGPLRRCPAHALYIQLARLRRLFPEKFDDEGRPDPELPLFPTDLFGGSSRRRRSSAPSAQPRIASHCRLSLRPAGSPGLGTHCA